MILDLLGHGAPRLEDGAADEAQQGATVHRELPYEHPLMDDPPRLVLEPTTDDADLVAAYLQPTGQLAQHALAASQHT